MNLEDCLIKPVTSAVKDAMEFLSNTPEQSIMDAKSIKLMTDTVLCAVRSHIKVNAAFRTVSDGLTGSMAVDVDHVEWHDDGELTVHLNYWPKPDQPTVLNPDFGSLEKADKRMSEMTPEEQDAAMELWMRKNIGWFTGDTQRHITFLLNRLTVMRNEAMGLLDLHSRRQVKVGEHTLPIGKHSISPGSSCKQAYTALARELGWVFKEHHAGTLEIDPRGMTAVAAVRELVSVLRQRVKDHELQIVTQSADIDIIRAKADVLASDLEAVRFCKKKLDEGVKRAGFNTITYSDGTVTLMRAGSLEPGHDRANPAVASLTKQLKDAQAEVVNMTGKLHEVETENNTLTKQLADAQAANNEMNIRLAASRAARTVNGDELEAALKERDELKEQLLQMRCERDAHKEALERPLAKLVPISAVEHLLKYRKPHPIPVSDKSWKSVQSDLIHMIATRDDMARQLKMIGADVGTCIGTETYWGLRIGGRYVLGTGTEIPVHVAETKVEAAHGSPSFTPRQIKVVAFDVTPDDQK